MYFHLRNDHRPLETNLGCFGSPGTRFFVHLGEPQIHRLWRKPRVSLIFEIKYFMKNHLYALAMVISIAIWCASVYLLLSKAPHIGIDIDVPRHGAHTLMFFGLAFMTTCSQRRPKIILTLAILYTFGAATEVAQQFNPPRTCDLLDFFEDVVGSTLGLTVAIVWMSMLRMFLRSSLWLRITKKDLLAEHIST